MTKRKTKDPGVKPIVLSSWQPALVDAVYDDPGLTAEEALAKALSSSRPELDQQIDALLKNIGIDRDREWTGSDDDYKHGFFSLLFRCVGVELAPLFKTPSNAGAKRKTDEAHLYEAVEDVRRNPPPGVIVKKTIHAIRLVVKHHPVYQIGKTATEGAIKKRAGELDRPYRRECARREQEHERIRAREEALRLETQRMLDYEEELKRENARKLAWALENFTTDAPRH